ncbi:hypothetical protein RJ639_006485 [Escallonia herrerae]|uniref:CRAL-TRIO domain-containing protein n=1 Tax=Escallonia herrerae TaxID=1293975 RepID=A0AA89AVA2_9ASTE|nr:hypothetical protein RJ639_006485 [Escallonia herrerae]
MFRRWRSQRIQKDDSSSQDAKHEVAHEGETGKVSRANFHDRMGRPVLIMRPGMQVFITQPSTLFSAGPQKTVAGEGNISHLVYLLENAILNLPEGQEQMSWLVDFTGSSINTNVPIKTAREIINTLQNHYPERLAIIILYNPPRIFEAFYKIVKYFVDQKTSQKIKFVYPNKKASVEIVKSLFDNENLPREFGGNGTLKYDHEEFSKLMVQDDVKTAKFWGFDNEQSRGANGHVGAEVAPEPATLLLPKSDIAYALGRNIDMPCSIISSSSSSELLKRALAFISFFFILTATMFRRWRSRPIQGDDSSSQDAKQLIFACKQVEELRAGLGTLSGRSAKFCTDACLRRYLEARSWNVEKAKKMLEETLKWRSTYKPEEIRWHEVAHEGETGKVSRANFHDRMGRPVLIMRPGMQIVKYFVDPKTSQKIKFVYPNNKASVEIVKSLFDSENLPSEFGGNATLKYDHEEFSRLMVQDDVKSAKFWGFDNEQSHDANRHVGAEVAPEPVNLAPPAH